MGIGTTEKTAIAVTKLIGGDSCGYRIAKIVLDGVKQPASPQMEAGIAVHETLENYVNGTQDLPDEMKSQIPDPDDFIEAEDYKKKKLGDVWISYKMDGKLEEKIIDWKTGQIYDESKLQGQLYNRLEDVETMDLVYFDVLSFDSISKSVTFKYRETLKVDGKITDEQIHSWIKKIEARELPKEKIQTCKYCHIRPECPLINGQADAEVENYSILIKQMDLLTAERANAYADRIKPMDDKLEELKESEKELRKTIEGKPPKKYPTALGSVNVIAGTRDLIKYKHEDIFPIAQNPKLWRVEPKKAEMNKSLTDEQKKRFTIPIPTIQIRVDNGAGNE